MCANLCSSAAFCGVTFQHAISAHEDATGDRHLERLGMANSGQAEAASGTGSTPGTQASTLSFCLRWLRSLWLNCIIVSTLQPIKLGFVLA
jgi:hypothetical protein